MAIRNGQNVDVLQGFNFSLIIENRDVLGGTGSLELHFRTVSGLEQEAELAEYREGGSKSLLKEKYPGLVNVTNIVLERGLSQDDRIMDWHQRIVLLKQAQASSPQIQPSNSGKIEIPRTNMTLYIYDRDRISNPVAKKKIRILRAFPIKLTLGAFDATSSDIVIETLELAHEGFYYL